MNPIRGIIFLVLNFIIAESYSQEMILFGGLGEKIDFEDPGQYDKILRDTANIWYIGKSKKVILEIPDNATFGEYSLFTDTSRYYQRNVNARVQFKLLLVEGGDVYFISFYRAFETEKNKDGIVFETSWDDGNTWNNVIFDSLITRNQDEQLNFEDFYSECDSIQSNPGKVGFTGNNSEGGFSIIQFYSDNRLIGDTVLLRLTFTSDSNETNNEGWIMDEIVFKGVEFGSVGKSLQIAPYRIYPNPAKDRINIASPFDLPVNSVELLSISGQVLLIAKNKYLIDINIIPAGIYIIRINDIYNFRVIIL